MKWVILLKVIFIGWMAYTLLTASKMDLLVSGMIFLVIRELEKKPLDL